MTTQTFQTIRTCLWRMIRWTAGDAAMGALCAALFGMIYGGFETLVYGNPWRIVLTAGYFLLAGGVAGALLGAVGAFLESIDASSADSNACNVLDARQAGVPAESRLVEGSDFQRPTALTNPLIARWQFVENMARNETLLPPNSIRPSANGSLVTASESRLAENGLRRQPGLAPETECRRPLRHVRWISKEEAND